MYGNIKAIHTITREQREFSEASWATSLSDSYINILCLPQELCNSCRETTRNINGHCIQCDIKVAT